MSKIYLQQRVSCKEAKVIAGNIAAFFGERDMYELCGSYRRGKDQIDDLHLVLFAEDERRQRQIEERLIQYFKGGKKGIIFGIQTSVQVSLPKNKGAMIMHMTGTGEYNKWIRIQALKQGKMLNEKGLWERESGEYICGATEEEIFQALDLTYVKPEYRNVGAC